MRLNVVRKGIFRTRLPGLGECARVDMSAGDAAPYLEREMYDLLGFQPRFDQLPEREITGRWSRPELTVGPA